MNSETVKIFQEEG